MPSLLGLRRAQDGQALPIVALAMVALIGFLGLALDGGRAYLAQRSLQRGADMAALAAASSYFRSNYAGSANGGYPASVSTGMTDALAAATGVVTKDGYAASVTGTPAAIALDYQGNDLANQCNPTCPTAAQVRGFRVNVTLASNTYLMQALGISQATVTATAKAMLTVPGGATTEAPVLLQNFSDLTHFVPRNSGYTAQLGPCAGMPGDGVQYAPTPDCRPKGGATPVVLVPAYESFLSEPALNSKFSGAQKASFYPIHDLPSNSAGGAYPGFCACDAQSATVQNGEGVSTPFLTSTCQASPCSAPLIYVELSHTNALGQMQNDNFPAGMNSRISTGTVTPWDKQDCSQPNGGSGGVQPLTADNPRLMRLPISYAAPLTTGINVASSRISETVMFCVQYTNTTGTLPQNSSIPSSGNNYAITGYFVNVSDQSPVTTGSPSPYFGQDVSIRLLS